MSWLLFGSSGQLGKALQKILTQESTGFYACGHAEVDITDIACVGAIVESKRPTIIVNLAAWTNVDGAESYQSEAYRVNATGAENIAKIAAQHCLPLIHVSTDYVFDGTKTTPYLVSDATNPLSVYGKSKEQGEVLVQSAHPTGSWIIRTAWLYSPYGKNFAKSIIKKALLQEDISVVNDVLGQPTSALALARQLVLLVSQGAPAGIYHGTNSGSATWFDFATALTQSLDLQSPITPVSSGAFPTVAPRPNYSVLDHSEWLSVGMKQMPLWSESLSEILPDLITSVEKEMA